MNYLQIFSQSICFIIILLSSSCSVVEWKNQSNFGQINQSNNKSVTKTKVEVIWGENGELTTKDITQNRNMTQYDQGGYFDCWNYIYVKEPVKCDENKIRDFIWQHWSEKKCGYIRVTYDSQDATSTSNIFIEPNEKGEWNVAWRIARKHAIPEYSNKIDDVLGIVSVEQMQNKPEKGKWALVFKYNLGSIVEKLPNFGE